MADLMSSFSSSLLFSCPNWVQEMEIKGRLLDHMLSKSVQELCAGQPAPVVPSPR